MFTVQQKGKKFSKIQQKIKKKNDKKLTKRVLREKQGQYEEFSYKRFAAEIENRRGKLAEKWGKTNFVKIKTQKNVFVLSPMKQSLF